MFRVRGERIRGRIARASTAPAPSHRCSAASLAPRSPEQSDPLDDPRRRLLRRSHPRVAERWCYRECARHRARSCTARSAGTRAVPGAAPARSARLRGRTARERSPRQCPPSLPCSFARTPSETTEATALAMEGLAHATEPRVAPPRLRGACLRSCTARSARPRDGPSARRTPPWGATRAGDHRAAPSSLPSCLARTSIARTRSTTRAGAHSDGATPGSRSARAAVPARGIACARAPLAPRGPVLFRVQRPLAAHASVGALRVNDRRASAPHRCPAASLVPQAQRPERPAGMAHATEPRGRAAAASIFCPNETSRAVSGAPSDQRRPSFSFACAGHRLRLCTARSARTRDVPNAQRTPPWAHRARASTAPVPPSPPRSFARAPSATTRATSRDGARDRATGSRPRASVGHRLRLCTARSARTRDECAAPPWGALRVNARRASAPPHRCPAASLTPRSQRPKRPPSPAARRSRA